MLALVKLISFTSLLLVTTACGGAKATATTAPGASSLPSASAAPSSPPTSPPPVETTPASGPPFLGPSAPAPGVPAGLASSDSPPPMTTSSAGGACSFGPAIVLGASRERVSVTLGFGAKSGLASWLDVAGMLRVRPLDLAGAPTGEAATIALDKGERPFGVEPLGVDFVVTVTRDELVGQSTVHHRRVVLVRPDGKIAGPFSSVGAPDLWSKYARTESRGGRYASVGHRGGENKGAQPAVWIEVHANPDGTVVEDVRPLEPPFTTDSGDPGARVLGEGPFTILLRRTKTAVVQGRVLSLRNASLARIDARENVLSGTWLPGGKPGLLGAPDRHLRLVWFEGDKLHAADVRADGTTTNETTHAPLAAIPGIPYEIDVWGGGHSNVDGFAPSFSRRHVFLPQWKTVKGVSSEEKRFRLPDVKLDGGAMLPIEDGTVEWSGKRIVYAYREGTELRVRSAECSGR
jgi:hypothetical protein